MKYLKSYSNQYYTNESIKDYLKPKSEEDIYKLTKNLSTDEKIEYGITYDLDWLIREAIEEGFKLNINHLLRSLMTNKLNVAKMIIVNNLVNLSDDDNQCILQAVSRGYTEILELLLKDKRIDPTMGGFNFPLREALNRGYFDMVELLLNDKRVRNSLSRKERLKYESQIKNNRNITESIKDFLKPKSEDEIMSKMEGLSPYKKFYRGCQHGIIQSVKQAVEEGINPKVENQVGLRMTSDKGYLDIVKYLLSMYKNWDIISDEAVKNAAKKDHSEILKLFLNDKRCEFDPTENNYYIIHYCAINKKYKSLKVLLNNDIVNNKWNGEMDKYEKQLEEYENNK